MEKTLEQANAELLARKAAMEAQRQTGAPKKPSESTLSSFSFKGLSEAQEAEERAQEGRLRARQKEIEDAESLRRRWTRARVPARHEKRAVEESGPWADAFANLKARLGSGFLVAILGIRGAGKTQLGVEAIRHQVEAGHEGRYVKAMDLIIRFREAFRKDGPTEKAVMDEFLTPEILVIDAMEERAETQFEDRMISHLIDIRYDAMLDTILISNQIKEAFQQAIGNSAVSRLIETGEVIECTWESFRRKQA